MCKDQSIVRGEVSADEDVNDDRPDVPVTADSIKSYLTSNNLITLKNQHINVDFLDGGSKAPGSRVQVAINYPFVPVLPMLEKFGFNITIPAVAQGVIVY